MPKDLHTDLQLVGRHIPDSSVETDANGNRHVVELPGFYEIGTYVEGAWLPIFRRKAPGLFADIERAKQAQASSTTEES